VRGGSTNVEVADLLNLLPNAGLEHPLDSVHRRSLVLFHFYAAPRFLPFVLDGQRQAVAEPLHVLEHTLTRLHDHGTDLDQQLRRPYMRDRPLCDLVTSRSFISAPLLDLEGEAGQRRPQWTTAQDDPQTGRHASHAAMRGNCTTEDEPGTASYCMLVQPKESLDLLAVVRQVG